MVVVPLVGVDAASMEWSAEVEQGRLFEGGLHSEFEDGEGGLVLVDEMGSLSRLQKHVVPSAQIAAENCHPTDPHCPLVISLQFLSHPKLQSNQLVLSDVTLHGTMAAKIFRLPSIES